MDSQMTSPTINNRQDFNLFVKLLSGKSLLLKLSSPIILSGDLKRRIFEITRIPPHHQRLLTGVCQIDDDSIISCSGEPRGMFPTVHLLLRLLGGKGGFGSLLRGAATKAGQKKTNNFDACRDMSGRRLRHVNAEKRLEEWRAGEEGRRLEKVAEEFLKKNAKVGKKGTGDGEALKYVEKYRKESEQCMAEVEESVREAIMAGANGKRKGALVAKEKEAKKKMKIWMGKRKLGESDGDDTDEDLIDDLEENKSIILNTENQSGSDKEAGGSSGSVSGEKQGKCSGGSSGESGSEDDKEVVLQGHVKSNRCLGGASHDNKLKNVTEQMVDDKGIVIGTVLSPSVLVAVSDTDVVLAEEVYDEVKSGEGESIPVDTRENGSIEFDSTIYQEIIANASNLEVNKPINMDEFNSAEEMEVLGLERLKSELQTRGLKCGGTLQERASRLFLLRTTPLDKLPKKLLAKK